MNIYNNIKTKLIDNEIYNYVKDYSKNKNELETYYNVGKILQEAIKNSNKTSKELIKEYSTKLSQELEKDYSIIKLKNILMFYNAIEEGMTLSYQLTWHHYQELLMIDDLKEREYYLNKCIEKRLNTKRLHELINSESYKKEINI